MSAEPWIVLTHRTPARNRSIELRPRHLLVAGLAAFALHVGAGMLGLTVAGPEQTTSGGLRGEMAARLRDLESVLVRSGREEARARVVAGLPPVGSDVLALGTGGAPAPTNRDPFDRRTRRLIQQCEIQRASYREVASRLEARRRLWDRIPLTRPVPAGYISSRFGERTDPFTQEEAFHAGIDIRAPSGSPVYATARGVVVQSGWHNDYGRLIVIDHGGGLETRYAHAGELLVAEGDTVSRGQLIARVGSSGRVTAPHLHYEVRRGGVALNPERFLAVGLWEPD